VSWRFFPSQAIVQIPGLSWSWCCRPSQRGGGHPGSNKNQATKQASDNGKKKGWGFDERALSLDCLGFIFRWKPGATDFGFWDVVVFCFPECEQKHMANIAPTKKFDGNPSPFLAGSVWPPRFLPGPKTGAGPFLSGREVSWCIKRKISILFCNSPFCLAEHFWDAKVEMY